MTKTVTKTKVAKDSRAPSFDWKEINRHSSADSCWIVINGEVYDVTDFLAVHPGGDSIVLDYAGKEDCANAFYTDVHQHSESAVSLLNDYFIGYVEGARKTKSAEGNKKELVDFKKAVLPQILKMGAEYQDWVHTTATMRMRIFEWEFFEKLSFHPWWYIFFMWIPTISYMVYLSLDMGNSPQFTLCLFLIGMFAWTLIEYLIHRFIFHMSTSTPFGNFIHFFLHGAHHLTPMDSQRLTFPPTFAPPVGLLLYTLVSLVFPKVLGMGLFAGGAFMYMLYDWMHYLFHHGDLGSQGYLGWMKRRHMSHHFKDGLRNFGVTSPLWDVVFGTNGPEWFVTDIDPLATK
jgi:cytochrome b involved in lipid metabolism